MPKRILVVLLFTSFCSQASAQSGVNPEIANCREIQDPATQTQAELCAAWAPCKFVLGIHKACAKARSFIDGLKNLSWSDRKPDTSDFFDTAAPLPKGDGTLQQLSRTIREKYVATPNRQTQSGEFDDGVKWHYEGGIENGKRHGAGVLVSENGKLFRGEFFEGRQIGLGELVEESSRRAGVMSSARLNGPGVERFNNGTRYEGEFKDGAQDGAGTVYWSFGERFDGTFKSGKVDSGSGTWPQGGTAIYRGSLRGGMKEGRGTLIIPQDRTYTGEFKADKMHGNGEWIFARDGSRWTGEFRDNLAWNVRIVETNGQVMHIANGKGVPVVTTRTVSPPPQSSNDVNWGAVAQGLANVAGAYAASRGGAASVPAPAPLPPVQYQSYGQPAPVAAARLNQDANRYYPLLGCVANSREGPSSYANGICAKNNCGRSVNMVWERGNTGVAASGCYPSMADFGALLGACEGSDLYDRGRRMCKR